MLALPETLTLDEASATLHDLEARLAADEASVWRIDASPLRSYDSSALAVLLECRRLATAGSRRLAVEGMPRPLVELADLYGVADLLGLAVPEPAA